MSRGIETRQFQIRAQDFEPAYLKLHRRGELHRRAEEAMKQLKSCMACPRNCRVNRLENKKAVCKTGRYALVSCASPHLGEEDCLRGWNGSGTIFFSMCNLRCVFCQNYDISQEAGEGSGVKPEQLARTMIELQDRGCHNINFVTPEHVVPQILEAIPLAVEMGLRLPIVYNTSAYDSLDSLRLMDGIVDIYMPDFKFWDPDMSKRYVKAQDYPEAARAAIKEMYRQVGDLVFDENGLAKRGLLVRHLMMPGEITGTREILGFLVQEVSIHTYVNIMDQYYPAGVVSGEKYAEINRQITGEEHEETVRIAREEGIYRFDTRRLPIYRPW